MDFFEYENFGTGTDESMNEWLYDIIGCYPNDVDVESLSIGLD